MTGRQLLYLGVVLVLLVALFSALIIGSGSNNAAAGEVLLQPVNSKGPFPWTDSLVPPGAPTSVPLPTTAPPATTSTTRTAVLSSVTGDRAGIYGGTLEVSVCDKNKLIDFLEQHPAQGAAWAAVEGIRQADIRTYIGSLTPVILGADTRVTNHGFNNGKATTLQSVLQAGTAVLIDNLGVPRARCYCGNPLLPPQLTSGTPKYTGDAWPTFDPGRVIVVEPAPSPIVNLTVINTNGSGPLTIPVGGTTSTTTSIASTAPTASTASTAPPLATVTAPSQTVPSQTGPPSTTGQAYRLSSIRVTRSYGGYAAPGSTGTFDNPGYPIQPGQTTVPTDQTQFQFGWDFNWGDQQQNRNRAVATVDLTQVSSQVNADAPAPFAATISGEWLSSGYGVNRDHTVSLAGAAGDASKDFGDDPDGSFNGTLNASGSTPPTITSTSPTQAIETITCDLRFGNDHTGEMVIELFYDEV